MVRPQPLIAVADVEASSRWYCEILGCQSGHGGDIYERIIDGEEIVLQLHVWEEDHPNLVDRDRAPVGHGVLLWFHCPDFDRAVGTARRLNAEIVEDVHTNPNAGHREIWLRDPDGYVVVLAGDAGDLG